MSIIRCRQCNEPYPSYGVHYCCPYCGGEFIGIQEDAILPANRELAKKGIYVEPTSALVWCKLDKIVGSVLEPVVLIMSGSGLKYQS